MASGAREAAALLKASGIKAEWSRLVESRGVSPRARWRTRQDASVRVAILMSANIDNYSPLLIVNADTGLISVEETLQG